ncbi:MAG: OB-fold domain-containing protein [Acidobacteria bacterium]|nr:OB-fold domain-containing protein [Acidobacteriota bacterium]
MTEMLPERPFPVPTPDSQPYWDGLRAHRLVLQRCAACGRARHYPRPMCDTCFSLKDEWFTASGKGCVHSWTVCHHAFHRGFASETPYVLVTVELVEGVRMVARLVEPDTARLAIDRPVILEYQDLDDITLPRFRIDG